MSLLFSGPPELVARMFESCADFGDALALALSCKQLHSVWVLNLSKITLEIARTSVLSFDEALIAVRATEISLDLFLISVISYDLWNFSFFVEKNTETSWGRGSTHLLDEAPHLLESWRLGFHRALYRFVIAGAVLARAYQTPVYENFVKLEPWRGNGFLGDAVASPRDQGEGPEYKITWLPVTAAELNTLNEYLVYNFTPHEDWERCFGHLADWLVESIRTRLSHDAKLSGNDRAIEQATLREIMQLLVMSGQFFDIEDGIWAGSEAPYWSKHYLDTTGCCICQSRPEDSAEEYEEYIPTQGPQERLRKFSYVSFCGFTCSELHLPAVREFHENS